jgi:hypothetical protein
MNIESVYRLICHMYKRDTLVVQPLFDDFPGARPAERAIVQKYAISGKIRVPHRDGSGEVYMQGTIALVIHEASHPEITELEGAVPLGTWNLG